MNDATLAPSLRVRSKAKAQVVESAPAPVASSEAPSGYRTRRDVLLSMRAGTLKIEANRPVRDNIVIEQLRRAGIKLDPFWD